MAKKASKKKLVVLVATAFSIGVAHSERLSTTERANNAAKVKAKYRTRKAARKALMPGFVKEYKLPKGAKPNGKSKGKAGTANSALNNLLTRAFKAKAKGKHGRTIPNVDAQAARIVSGHSTAYTRRLIERLRQLIKK